MSTPFEQLLIDLKAAQGDAEKLALVTFDFAVRDDAELRAAAEAVAVPRWFDEKVVAALLPEHAGQAAGFLEKVKALPMCEPYPTENREPAWNLHEATRRALRRRMLADDLERFIALSDRAADHFSVLAGPLEETKEKVETCAAFRIEAICHRLLSEPEKGTDQLAKFVSALLRTHHAERLQGIAALIAELLEDGAWDRCVAASRTRDATDWADAQYSLAYALDDLGTRVEPVLGNQLLAATADASRAALDVYTRENAPEQWAATQNNLGNVLSAQGVRSEGQQAVELLGLGVNAYRQALEVYDPERLPQDWAMTQNNLGNTLWAQGIRSEAPQDLELLEQAVNAYREALKVHTRMSLPEEWATTQSNLGNALWAQSIRSEGQRPLELLRQAVTAYRLALEVRTRETLPHDWAGTQNNLGIALRNLGVRSEGPLALQLLREAESAYRAALEVLTYESLPQDWAMTQNNLGAALRAIGERTDDASAKQLLYREAETAYLAALKVYTSEALPHAHAQTQRNLDILRAKIREGGT